ncbi:MAG: hypothetical protein AAF358_03245 [Pseudomonadota bacterium]
MATYAVRILVKGPLIDSADGDRFAGAYSNRYVSATDEVLAKKRALEALRQERQFRALRRGNGIDEPETEIDSVRRASWLEGLSSSDALVLCRDKSPALTKREF